MKILIVEDEPSLQDLIKRTLERERYLVEYASTYQSALRKIEDYEYDCILVDIMLPDGNGLSLLKVLKKMQKRDSVIITSAKDALEDKIAGLEFDANFNVIDIDDADFVETSNAIYYLLELEKDNIERKVKIDESGNILN